MRQWNDIKLDGGKGFIITLLETNLSILYFKELIFRNFFFYFLGISSFELKTSEKPVLGKWKIIAHLDGYQKALYIQIGKYVLPKFQVTINPPKYILIDEKDIEAEFCAK